MLSRKIIALKIKNFIGQNGQIEQLVFENGETISRKGGFVLTQWIQSSDFGKELGCENNSLGVLHAVANDVRGGVVPRSGHFVAEENPDYVTRQLLVFFSQEKRFK
jgi:hypothetical protein